MTWLALMALIAAEPPQREVVLTAERVLHDTRQELSTAEGNAQLTTAGAAVSADRIVYDKHADLATAAGHVVARLAQGGLVSIVADVVTFRFDGEEVSEIFVNDGQAISRTGVAPETFLTLDTPAKLAAAPPVMRLEGNHFEHHGALWRVERISLTPCDCDVSNPSWAIRASKADINLTTNRATLWVPTVGGHSWTWGLPFTLGIPISIPLTDRQTGLLFPKPTFTGRSGFGFEQPVFITLGRSADLTLTPGYFAGAFNVPTDGGVVTPTVDGIQGPRLMTEFRYAPAQDVSGAVVLGLLYDLKQQRDAVTGTPDGGVRGLRGEVSWNHTHNFGNGFGARVDAQAHSDGFYWRDGVMDVLAREAGYLRSTASVFHRGPSHLLSLEVGLRQDIQWGFDLFGRSSSTVVARAPSTFHRLPALTFAVPLRSLIGPVAFDLESSFVRLAPLRGVTGDEGSLANQGRSFDASGQELSVDAIRRSLYCTSDCLTGNVGMGDGVFQLGEREARDRLNVLPRLWASWRPGDVISLSTWAGWRQNVWFSEATGAVDWRGYPILDAKAETELVRDFESVQHLIRPSLEFRTVPVVFRSSDIAPYDEIDRAVVDASPHAQLVAELSSRLIQRSPGALTASLRVDLGQGVELVDAASRGPRIAESYARLAGQLGWLSGAGQVRFDPKLLVVTRVSGSAGLDFGAGWGLSGAYENLLDDGTNRTRQPLDLLFGAPVLTTLSRAQLLSAQARGRFGPVSVRYDALFLSRDWGRPDKTQPLTFSQHSLAVGWSPNCDCWRLEATVSQQFNVSTATVRALELSNRSFPFVNFGFNFTVSKFGSFGS